MGRLFIVVLIIIGLNSCSILNKPVEKETVVINNGQLLELINSSVSELVSYYWLTDYLTDKQERPIVMFSSIETPKHISIDREFAYTNFDLSFLKTGQVRVVKSTNEQRLVTPMILASGESVDFVITAIIIEPLDSENNNYTFTLMLWNEEGSIPVSSISKEFKIKITE